MSGTLFNIAKRNAKFIINRGGYQVDITLMTPTNNQTINITGWGVKIWGAFDSDGNQVNTKNVHVTIDEDALTTLDYPIRNLKGEINLIHHKVQFNDSSGILRTYMVRENFPDENLGLILLVLGDYKFS